MLDRVITLMHCFDDHYAAPAAVAMLSMLECANPNYFYSIVVVHDDISIVHQRMLKEVVDRFDNAELVFRNGDAVLVKELFDAMNTKGHYSKEVLYKLVAPKLFPNCSHLIVADVDVVYCDDIAVSYNNFLKDCVNYVAGIPWDAKPCKWVSNIFRNCYSDDFSAEEQRFFTHGIGGGYLIYNLDAMRRDGIVEKMLKVFRANARRLKQAEQDVINMSIPDKIHRLSQRDMVCTYHYEHLTDEESKIWSDALDHPVQLHYATSTKPWNNPGSAKSHIWWSYLCRTPFFYEIASSFDKEEKISICKFAGFRIAKIWHTGTIEKLCLVNSIPLKTIAKN